MARIVEFASFGALEVSTSKAPFRTIKSDMCGIVAHF
jgi:hypothetical protein